MTTTTEGQPAAVDQERMTRAERAALALTTDVAQELAEQHGVCVRPLAMRRIDTTTGRVEVVPVPCGSTREDQCRPCSEKARRLRAVSAVRAGTSRTNPSPTGPSPPRNKGS